jgi:hypothetical protein
MLGRGRGKLKNWKRIIAGVMLAIFCRSLGFGEQSRMQLQNSGGSGTRLWSESEVGELIEEITAAAEEAIEKAAAEAARAAALASVEREAAAVAAMRKAKKGKLKAALIAGGVCFFVGAAAGVAGTIIFRR